MLTTRFYQLLANMMLGRQRGSIFFALGRGSENWDQNVPVYDRQRTQLEDEILRKPVDLTDVVFVDEENNPIRDESTRIRISTNFLPGEGVDSMREAGVFMGETASSDANSGELVCYYMHPLIEKSDTATLARQFLINLTPSISSGSQFVTQFLGNSNSREVHNLENEQGNCQISEISFDRIIYFTSLEHAQASGYDACGHCFGRDLSQR